MMISAMLPTVDAEIGGEVVLPISAKQHPFSDRDLSVIQCHVGLSALELRFDQHATIRAQSCVRGNLNPQISRLGNGPDRDCQGHAALKRRLSGSALTSRPVVSRGAACSVTNCTDGRSNCSLTTGIH